jgi:hypothetical protein
LAEDHKRYAHSFSLSFRSNAQSPRYLSAITSSKLRRSSLASQIAYEYLQEFIYYAYTCVALPSLHSPVPLTRRLARSKDMRVQRNATGALLNLLDISLLSPPQSCVALPLLPRLPMNTFKNLFITHTPVLLFPRFTLLSFLLGWPDPRICGCNETQPVRYFWLMYPLDPQLTSNLHSLTLLIPNVRELAVSRSVTPTRLLVGRQACIVLKRAHTRPIRVMVRGIFKSWHGTLFCSATLP